jgi:hypothetical protein
VCSSDLDSLTLLCGEKRFNDSALISSLPEDNLTFTARDSIPVVTKTDSNPFPVSGTVLDFISTAQYIIFVAVEGLFCADCPGVD